MQLYNGFSQYVPANTSSMVLHSGPGKIHAIILTGQNATADSLTLYDEVTAVGDVLLKLNVSLSSPVLIHFDRLLPLVFETGLTAATTTGCVAFLLTEF